MYILYSFLGSILTGIVIWFLVDFLIFFCILTDKDINKGEQDENR
jgi:hypothetical protein